MAKLVLTGVLAASDSFGRLRLSLVDRLASGHSDGSWFLLKKAVPFGGGKVPYNFPLKGQPDGAGIRGECWITVPKSRQFDVLALAESLRGKEVEVSVRARRYSFKSDGETVKGTSLLFAGGLTLLSTGK